MTYESLENEITKQGVEVIYFKFKGKLKGLYTDGTIAIDPRIDTEEEKKCILAEEIGHFYKTIGNILDQTKIENIKQEKIARNWAYEKLVGVIDIINAFNAGAKSRYEIAEYLQVTEEFLESAIQHYREKYGVMFKVDQYVVYFQPSLGVLRML